MKNVNRHINNVDYWQADILSAYDYSPFGVMLSGRTFEKEEIVQVCHDSTTLTTLTVLNENFSSWFTWTTMGSALLTYVDGEMQVSNPSNSSNNIGASKTFVTGSGVHSVSFDIIDNTCATIVLWPPSVTPKTIVVSIKDNLNNVVATGNYTTAGTYNLSFTPTSSGLTYKMEFYMTSASAFCYYRIDDVLITYQDTDTVQVCENVSKKGSYPRGFNGMLKDDEVKGSGNNINYEYRMHDTRIGRFLSIDALTTKYPWYSPYQFAGNKPIWAIDVDGLEEYIKTYKYEDGKAVLLKVVKNSYIVQEVIDSEGGKFINYRNIVYDKRTGKPMDPKQIGQVQHQYYDSDNKRLKIRRDYDGNYVSGDNEMMPIHNKNYDNSIYIGRNNPIAVVKGKEIPDYRREPQDEVDAAALRHDQGYDKVGAAGVSGALFDEKTLNADIMLLMETTITKLKYDKKMNDDVTGKKITEKTLSRAKFVRGVFTYITGIKGKSK